MDNGVHDRQQEINHLNFKKRNRTISEIDGNFKSKVKRLHYQKRCGRRSGDITVLREAMSKRTGYHERIQGQIAMHDGPTGLYVMTAWTGCKDHCLHMVYPWIWILSHPECGHPNFNTKPETWNKIPMYIHPEICKRDKKNGGIKAQELIRTLQRIPTLTHAEARKEDSDLYRLWKLFGHIYPLPDAKSPVNVDLKLVHAQKGSLVFYKSFHGNAACSTPTVVCHLDYMPHSMIPDAEQTLLSRYRDFRNESHSLGAGSGRSPALETEFYRNTYRLSRGFKAPPLPSDSLSRAVLGGCDHDSAQEYERFKNIITQTELDLLHKQGYIVINPRYYVDDDSYNDWILKVNNARSEFERFFNWSILERNGIDTKKHYFRFSDLDKREEITSNSAWDLLKGQAECTKMLGEEHRYILNNSKTSDDGKTRVYVKTAQGGNGMATKFSGMGLATNFYRGPLMLEMTCHPIVVYCYRDFYDTQYVHNCTDRWRVKYGTGNAIDDHRPKSSVMPCHEDRFFNIVPLH